jgi:hypothetical protein
VDIQAAQKYSYGHVAGFPTAKIHAARSKRSYNYGVLRHPSWNINDEEKNYDLDAVQ